MKMPALAYNSPWLQFIKIVNLLETPISRIDKMFYAFAYLYKLGGGCCHLAEGNVRVRLEHVFQQTLDFLSKVVDNNEETP